MKLNLHEFIDATRSMHAHSGVKRTRLMLHLRPYDQRNTFVLKSTDDRHTFTTRVRHQGQIKLVENLVNGFVQCCTAATLHAAAGHTAAHTTTITNPNATQAVGAHGNAQVGAATGGGERHIESSSAKTQETVTNKNTSNSNHTTSNNNSNNNHAKKGSSGSGGKQRGGGKQNKNTSNNNKRNR